MTHPTDAAIAQANELMVCPFCGAGETRIQLSKYWTGMQNTILSATVRHWCDKAEDGTQNMLEVKGRTEAAAIAAWNRRTPPAQAAEAVERVALKVTDGMLHSAAARYDSLAYEVCKYRHMYQAIATALAHPDLISQVRAELEANMTEALDLSPHSDTIDACSHRDPFEAYHMGFRDCRDAVRAAIAAMQAGD